MLDPHLIRKIQTATTHEELDGMIAAFEARGEFLPEDARNAMAHKRIALTQAGVVRAAK